MKHFILITFLLAFFGLVKAESCLVIDLKAGTSQSYVLKQQPRITFGEGTLHVNAPEAEADFALADIANFHFADVEIEGIALQTQSRFSFIDGQVSLQGFAGRVLLTDLNGRLLLQHDEADSHLIDLTRYPKGIYILRIGSQSIKLKN